MLVVAIETGRRVELLLLLLLLLLRVSVWSRVRLLLRQTAVIACSANHASHVRYLHATTTRCRHHVTAHHVVHVRVGTGSSL